MRALAYRLALSDGRSAASAVRAGTRTVTSATRHYAGAERALALEHQRTAAAAALPRMLELLHLAARRRALGALRHWVRVIRSPAEALKWARVHKANVLRVKRSMANWVNGRNHFYQKIAAWSTWALRERGTDGKWKPRGRVVVGLGKWKDRAGARRRKRVLLRGHEEEWRAMRDAAGRQYWYNVRTGTAQQQSPFPGADKESVDAALREVSERQMPWDLPAPRGEESDRHLAAARERRRGLEESLGELTSYASVVGPAVAKPPLSTSASAALLDIFDCMETGPPPATGPTAAELRHQEAVRQSAAAAAWTFPKRAVRRRRGRNER